MNVQHVAIGEVAFGKAGSELRTILGSCVAITLWNPEHKVGSLCHIQYAQRARPYHAAPLDGHYTEEAWALMCHDLASVGLTPRDCVCKLFGGASVTRFGNNVGERNLISVQRLLHSHAIAVASTHVSGTGYRELRFRIATGEALVRHHVAPALHTENGR